MRRADVSVSDLERGEVALVVAGLHCAASVHERAAAVGAEVVEHDLASQGLDSLVARVGELDAAVVHLPGLLGRWLPPATAGAPRSTVRAVVLEGSVLDERSAAGVAAAFGGDVVVVASRSGPVEPALWEVEARLRSLPGVAAAVVSPMAEPSAWRGWVELEPGGELDLEQAQAVLGGPDAVVEVVAGHLADVEAQIRHEADDLAPNNRPGSLGPRRLPANDLEQNLVAVFEHVLDVRPVGTTDGFLELGGTPEQAAWLADEIAWRCELPLRAAELIDHPTVEQVAALVRRDGGRRVRRPVTVTLASGPDHVPTLFLLHGADGSAFSQLDLAAGLHRPVVGFESPLRRGGPSPFESLELMALRYVNDVRRAQPEGPYHLAGWGFGGALAFEIARQLVGEAATVDRLIVADIGPTAQLSTDHSGRPSVLRRLASRRAPSVGVAVPPAERSAHARSEHRRLLDAYRWPVGNGLPIPVTVGWSSDVGAGDATMGWASLVGADRVEIERFATAHTDADDDPPPGWSDLLRS